MPRRSPPDDDDPFLPDEGELDDADPADSFDDPAEDDPVAPTRSRRAARPAGIGLNTLATVGILVLGVLVGVLIYAVVQRSARPVVTDVAPSPAVDSTGTKPIQLDVLNGCGAAGVGTKFRSFLQSRGFDVVASENYNTFNVVESLVIDRRGDMIGARKVARALGIADQNVIQQVSNDYYLDVSVVVGRDFARLRPYQN